MRTLALPDLLRGLILQQGWSTTAAAHVAGISPLAAKRWCSELTDAASTWLRMISTFRAEVRILRGEECWIIAFPPVSQPVRERQRRSWRNRRFIHYLHALAVQSPKMKRSEKETRSRSYVVNEEARIVAGIEEARRRMTTVLLAGEMDGMRTVLKALVRASHITSDELAFASGVSSDASVVANEVTDDGRLLPLRRLMAALDARLEIHFPSGNRVVIARVDAGHPKSVPVVSSGLSSRRAHVRIDHDGSRVRSSLDRDAILTLYDAGTPITQIAEQAGISRQRVHAIAKVSGRLLRRSRAVETRTAEAQFILA